MYHLRKRAQTWGPENVEPGKEWKPKRLKPWYLDHVFPLMERLSPMSYRFLSVATLVSELGAPLALFSSRARHVFCAV